MRTQIRPSLKAPWDQQRSRQIGVDRYVEVLCTAPAASMARSFLRHRPLKLRALIGVALIPLLAAAAQAHPEATTAVQGPSITAPAAGIGTPGVGVTTPAVDLTAQANPAGATTPAATVDPAASAYASKGAKGAQVYCYLRAGGNSHEVSWNAAYAVIKRQPSDSPFKTSPEHASVLITEAVIANPSAFPDCSRYLGTLFEKPASSR
jgi:hypothetical protein